ncbi:DUF4097 family beta strand repeat-containing protein [Sessilibacter corallicola]|uniref:DUF4097 family beta strand repeat-containing protein n=1 Tax=Sessilibacter corallicola TaxID=2904075 RepID=A0ABQ0A6G6_9GAMM
MKIIMSCLALTMPCIAIAAGQSIDEIKDTGSNPKIQIENVRGNVSIQAWDKNQVSISGTLDENTEKFIFDASESRVNIVIESDQPRSGWGHNAGNLNGSALVIKVPSNSKIDAEGFSTDFVLENILNDVQIESVSGDVDIYGNRARLNIDTVSGDINIEDHEGLVFVESVSGDIDYEGLATRIEAESVQGDIDINNKGELREGEFSSVSGDIDTKTNTDSDQLSLEWNAVSGDIQVFFLNPVSATFQVETMSGDIRNLLTEAKPDKNRWVGSSLTFNSGNGDGDVSISTVSGNVRIK